MPNGPPLPLEARPEKKRISRPHDIRAVRSRAALRQALLELIDVKQLDQISIKEITEQANVSYPVFFRQFSSREELLADLAAEQVYELLNQSLAAFTRDSEASLTNLCEYVQARRKLWATLLTAGASAAMRSEFSRISNEIAASRPRVNPSLPPDLITELVTNAIFDILTWWLRQAEDYPIDNVVKLLEGLVVQRLARPMDIELK